MSDHNASPRQQAESELARAYRSVGDGDLAHAAVHIAQAIASDPTLAESYEQLERLFATADQPERLIPLEGDVVYIGNLAARAHIAARSGNLQQAVHLLVRAAWHEPGTPWLSGGAMSEASTRGRLEPHVAAVALATLGRHLPTAVTTAHRAALEPFLDFAREVAVANPDNIEVAVHLSVFAEAVGADVEAEAWRTRAEAATPGPLGAIMMGYALKDAGQYVEMEAAWERAIAADPDNLDVYIDLAVAYVELDRHKDADVWLTRALRRNPDHDQATALRQALMYLNTGDPARLIGLVDAARDGDYAERVLSILVAACSTKTWLNRVPMPTETIVALVNYVAAQRNEGKTVSMDKSVLTAIEPASAAAAAHRVVGKLDVTVMSCPTPDLRVPQARVKYQVWRYDGGRRPIAHMPKPSAAAASLLREVANLTWTDPVSGFAQAARFADTPLDDLLGLLCHTPSSPDNDRWERLNKTGPTYWFRLAQPWICLGILHHRADEPWRSSTRRQVLVDLVYGVEDWVTDAALFALVVQAWNDPECRDDVLGIVRERFDQARLTSSRRLMTIAPSIAELLLITPGIAADDQARAKRLIKHADKPARNRFTHLWRTLQTRLGR